MAIRKRNDSVKGGCGIDGRKGENFSRQYARDPWDPPKLTDGINPKGAGKYTTDDSGLTNKMPEETTVPGSRDIFNAVEGQSSDSGNRAVRSRGQP